MNWQQMIEFCLEANPNRGEPYIRPILNTTLDVFAQKTRILKASTTAVMDTDTTTWALPSDLISVDRVTVTVNDRTGEIHRASWDKYNLFEGEYVWWIVGNTMHLGKITDQELVGVDLTFTIEYTKKFTHLASGTDLSTDSDVPLMFRMGICSRVREFLLNDPQQRAVEHAMWREAVKDGIRYAQHHKDDTDMRLIIHEL